MAFCHGVYPHVKFEGERTRDTENQLYMFGHFKLTCLRVNGLNVTTSSFSYRWLFR